MSKVFMSYSHKDEEMRDELETHLAQLKREGSITTWYDRRILPGNDFAHQIDENLEDSDIILLLVSPYFLASEYCYEIEMKRALERHENGEARVIPIILDYCDWQKAPFGKLNALPNDGEPISEYPNPNKALHEVTQGIRRVLESKKSKTPNSDNRVETSSISTSETVTTQDPQRSSNLRVKKDFSDKEKDDYLRNSYEYIYKFFKQSLDELKKRNSFIDSTIEQIDSQRFTVKLYKDNSQVSQCQIWRGESFANSHSIKYSNSIGDTNSYNEMLSVEDDGHSQYLRSSGLSRMSYNIDDKLSNKGAAEVLWSKLIEPLQR